jgi:hypothetical protein
MTTPRTAGSFTPPAGGDSVGDLREIGPDQRLIVWRNQVGQLTPNQRLGTMPESVRDRWTRLENDPTRVDDENDVRRMLDERAKMRLKCGVAPLSQELTQHDKQRDRDRAEHERRERRGRLMGWLCRCVQGLAQQDREHDGDRRGRKQVEHPRRGGPRSRMRMIGAHISHPSCVKQCCGEGNKQR